MNKTMLRGIFYGATVTAILGAFEPLAAVIVGVFVLGEPFTGTLAAGMIFIIAAVAVIVLSRKPGVPAG